MLYNVVFAFNMLHFSLHCVSEDNIFLQLIVIEPKKPGSNYAASINNSENGQGVHTQIFKRANRLLLTGFSMNFKALTL